MSPQNLKPLLSSPEVWTGGVLIVLGFAAFLAGIHDLLAYALAPFGVGLILCEIVTLSIHRAHERVKVRSRRDK